MAQTLAEAWNGATWAVQPTSGPAGAAQSRLESVSCTAPAACTAVGYYGNGYLSRTLAETK